MIVNTDGQPIQAVRNGFTEEVAGIPTAIDHTSGCRVVLWSDILAGFKGTTSVRNGDALVPFLDDGNLDPLTPLRIPYYPDDVLELVAEGHRQHTVTGPATIAPTSTEPKNPKDYLCSKCSFRDSSDTNSMADDITAPPLLSNIRTSNRSLPTTPQSSSTFDQQHGNHLNIATPGQHMPSVDTQQPTGVQDQPHTLEEILQRLYLTREEMVARYRQTLELQNLVNHNQELLSQLQQSARDNLVQKQDEVHSRQQAVISKMSIIIHRVQLLLTQTYDLHSHPVPRLFIVLPKTTGPTTLSTGQFRLYFLCECHSHSTSDGSRTPHHVHMAKHEGYDLDNPGTFFRKYRSYILAMMFMIKYGAVTGDIVVPPLASLSILDGIETDQEHLDYLKTNIVPLVDHMIDILQDPKSNGGTESEIEKVEALTGAELGHLGSYLSVQDEPFSLGRLFRIVTTSGHVKWVCSDHYSANYRSPVVSQLKEIVESSGGMFIEETGKVEIKVTSSADARVLYDTMIQAQRTQDVDIVLDWEATIDDVHDLYESITKANVVRLSVDGTQLKDSETDVGNQSRGIHPMLRLALNSRIQSLHILGFKNLFTRVTKSGLVPAPMLRVLSVEVLDVLDDGSVEHLNDILERCPGLETLDVISKQLFHVQETIIGSLSKMRKLQWLKVDYGRITMTSRFQDGKCQETIATVECLGNLKQDDMELLERSGFTRMVVTSPIKESDMDPMAEVLDRSHSFTHLQIRNESLSTSDGFKVQDLLKLVAQKEPGQRKLLSIDCGRLSLSVDFTQGRTDEMTLLFNRFDDLSAGDVEFIQHGPYGQLTVEYAHGEDKDRLAGILCQSVATGSLHIGLQDERFITIATTLDTNIQDLLRLAISRTSGKLQSVSLVHRRLTLNGNFLDGRADDMTLSVDRLDNLSSGDFEFIQRYPFTRLSVNYTHQEDENQLANILRNRPELNYVHVRRQGERCLTIATTYDMALQSLMDKAMTETPGKLESFSFDSRRLSLTASFWNGGIHHLAMDIKQLGGLSLDDLTFIQCGYLNQLSIEYAPQVLDECRLAGVLLYNPKLTQLLIQQQQQQQQVDDTEERELHLQKLIEMMTPGTLDSLDVLSVIQTRFSLAASFKQGRAQETLLTFDRLDDLPSIDREFIRKYHFTQLMIEYAQREDEAPLADILQSSQAYNYVHVRRLGEEHCLTVATMGMTLQDLLTKALSNYLNTLESLSVDSRRLSLTADVRQECIHNVAMKIRRLGDLSSDDMSFVRQGYIEQLIIESFPRMEDGECLADILRHNPKIARVLIQQQVNNTGEQELGLRKLVDLMRSECLNLKSLSIVHKRLTLNANFSHDGTQDAAMSFGQLEDLSSSDHEFISDSPFSRLTMEYARRKQEGRLAAIACNSSRHSFIHIRRQGESSLTVATTIDTVLQDLVTKITSDYFDTLESFSIDCGRLLVAADISQGITRDMTITVRQPNNLNSDDLAFIHAHNPTHVTIECTTPGPPDLLTGILAYNLELCQLRIRYMSGQDLAAASASDMGLEDLVGILELEPHGRLEQLSIDYRRFSVFVDFSYCKAQDTTVNIERLCDLGPNDLPVIQKSDITRLSIRHAMEADADRLVDIMRCSPSLDHLEIGCEEEHSLAILNLVISTREKILQETAEYGLHTLELMDQDLVTFDVLADCDDRNHIQAHVSFIHHSNSFDMRTWIRLKNGTSRTANEPVYDFVRQYGWSTVFLDENRTRNGSFASILDSVSDLRPLQLEALFFSTLNFTEFDLDRLDMIIKKSPNFKDIGLRVDLTDGGQLEIAEWLLVPYGPMVSKLQLHGISTDQLLCFALSIPNRNSLLALTSLEIWPGEGFEPPENFMPWIQAMVMAPLPCNLESTLLSWAPLKKLQLRNMELYPKEWAQIIKSLDMSTLEHLDLQETNFSEKQFNLLTDRASSVNAVVKTPLKVLNLDCTEFAIVMDAQTREARLDEFRMNAPCAVVSHSEPN
ncbi:hypothetical protein B0O80DRAFT_533517 [Mortierella sp. GBAus27b]|nr:hypothetical protein BGX31_000105 [Mortierella sp. GBA43]KAI8346580.1 hypothetical protein B0O80DRAFT_533517 [Mortierella sp. GBAus27b]